VTRDLRDKIVRDADLCVMCGLCLPHCPTYRETRDEGESPRGRIALMSALAADQLPLSARLEAHLDRCLGCRACEDVCPSKVPYGALIDTGRGLIRGKAGSEGPRRRLFHAAVAALLGHPRLMAMTARLLRFYQGSGWLRQLGRRLTARRPALARMERYLPPLPPPGAWRARYPAPGRPRGRVALFTGCVNPLFDPAALRASIGLLNRLGFDVHVPKGQVCCGALFQHDGRLEAARAFARRNVAAFAGDWDAVVFTASGCGVTLREYPLLLNSSPKADQGTADFAAACADINQFLTRGPWPGDMTPAPLEARVAVHDPCSMRRVLHQHASVYELLQNIPGVQVVPLPGNTACCGAAGSYMFTQPEMADRLLRHKLDAVTAAAPDVLVTSNLGCALHLAAGLRAADRPLPVMHPVTLLARQIEATERPQD
jgi:glycolate oxidase iron-sulfur subunit